MAKSSFNISTGGLIVIFAVGYMGYQLLHKAIGSDDSDSEETKPKVTTRAAAPDDDVTVTKKVMSDSEHDTVVVRSKGNEYVRIGEMVFCWHSNVLTGVFTKNGLVPGWQTMTNQPPPSHAP